MSICCIELTLQTEKKRTCADDRSLQLKYKQNYVIFRYHIKSFTVNMYIDKKHLK